MFLAKDRRLLEAFKRGETEAMEIVYRHYHRGVSAFLRKGFTFRSGTGHFYFKGIAEQHDLDNAVQEVFRRAFEERARNSYNGINSFTNWVLAIGRNMVINQFRNREISFSDFISPSDDRGHLTILDDEMTEEYSGVLYGRHARSQDAAFENSELKALIDEFTKDLSEHDRKLLVYRFADGLGQEESAKLLGSTRMKVRTAEARLRHRLRAFLRNSGYIDNIMQGDRMGPEASGAGKRARAKTTGHSDPEADEATAAAEEPTAAAAADPAAKRGDDSR